MATLPLRVPAAFSAVEEAAVLEAAVLLALERELGFALFDRSSRRAVLTEAGRSFYQTASPELIAKLESYLKTMKASVGKCEEFINADVAFHMEIINACGNAYTIAIMNETFQRRANLGKMLILSTGYYGGIYYHGILLDAFRKHDVKRARVMMEEHLQHGLYDLESDNLGQEKNDL